MKFLHLADLHLGKRLNDVSLLQDQIELLDQVEIAREDTLRKALDAGILADSEQQARTLLTTILTNMGFQRITIQN